MTSINDNKITAAIKLDPIYLEGMTQAYMDLHSTVLTMANRLPEFHVEHKFYSKLAKDIIERLRIVQRTTLDITEKQTFKFNKCGAFGEKYFTWNGDCLSCEDAE